MNNERKTAIIVGLLFLTAMVTSLVGGFWLEAILYTDSLIDSLVNLDSQMVLGVLLEMINAIAVIGIAVYLYPIFRIKYESLALGYVALRIIEVAIIVGAVISPLALIALNQNPMLTEIQVDALLSVREILVGQMLGIFFSLAAMILYYLLYNTKIIPRFISVWGFISVVLVLTWNLLELFDISVSFGMVFALSMILNEIFMAFWMIFKGFDYSPNTEQAV